MNNLIVSARWDLIELLNGQIIRLDLEDDHEFTLAATSMGALERLGEETFNSVLLDSSSPEVDVVTLLEYMIESERPEWVLVLTTEENAQQVSVLLREQDEVISYAASIADIFAVINDFPDNGYS